MLVPIDSLIPDPSNARKHSKKNLAAIKGSLARFGQQKPLVISKDKVVIAGNGTLFAAKELGWDKIEVIESKLTGAEITAFAIADNRTAELAEWDFDVLPGLLKSLKTEFDLGEIGFDSNDLAGLIVADVEVFHKTASEDDSKYTEEKEYVVDKINEKERDESIKTDHACPSCGYRW